MTNENRKNKGLVVALICLVCLIVVLAVAIVVVVLINNNGHPNCDGIKDEYEQNACLGEYFKDIDEEETIDKAYDKALDEMLQEKRYYAFADTLYSMMSLWAINERCDLALSNVFDERINQLPDQVLLYYYSLAQGVAMSCNDEAIVKRLDEKYDELINVVEYVTIEGDEYVE